MARYCAKALSDVIRCRRHESATPMTRQDEHAIAGALSMVEGWFAVPSESES